MPGKRNAGGGRRSKYPKNKGKRSYKRSYTTVVPRGFGFIAPRTIIPFKYSETQEIIVPPGTLGTQRWNLNSIYDPDRTGTGHQPYGYDQMEPLYNRYRVFAVRWVIDVATANDTLFVTVIPVNGNTTYTNASLIAESPKAITKAIGTATGQNRFRGKQYLPKLGGDKRVEYKTDDRFAAQFGASPTEIMTLTIGMNNVTGGNVTVRISTTLIYMTEVFDPVSQAQS